MSQQPTQPKKPLPPVAATSAVGVLLTAFVMAAVPAAILTYQDFASGNHDAASLLAIFGLALLSAISATGAITVHNKSNVPAGVQDALTNIIVPALANLTNGMNATLSHVAQPPAQQPIHINNIMPGAAPQAPVQPLQQPYTPIPQAATQIPIQPYQAPQFVPYTPQAASTFNLPAQPLNLPQQQQATDVSSASTQSSIPVPAMIDPAWNDSKLVQAIPPIASKQA